MECQSRQSSQADKGGESLSHGVMWWATLLVAVLAVPSFGIIASLMWGSRGVGELVVFVAACWVCTYLGMHLMKNPKMSKPFDHRNNP